MPQPLTVCCASICVLDQVRANAAICTRYDFGSIVTSSAVVSTGTNSLHAFRLSRPAILPGSACSPEPPSMICFTIIQRLQTFLSTSSSTQQMSMAKSLKSTHCSAHLGLGLTHVATFCMQSQLTRTVHHRTLLGLFMLIGSGACAPGVDVLVSTKGGHSHHTQLQRSSNMKCLPPGSSADTPD